MFVDHRAPDAAPGSRPPAPGLRSDPLVTGPSSGRTRSGPVPAAGGAAPSAASNARPARDGGGGDKVTGGGRAPKGRGPAPRGKEKKKKKKKRGAGGVLPSSRRPGTRSARAGAPLGPGAWASPRGVSRNGDPAARPARTRPGACRGAPGRQPSGSFPSYCNKTV